MLSFIYTGSIDNIDNLHLPFETDCFLDPVVNKVVTSLELLKISDIIRMPQLQKYICNSPDDAPIRFIHRGCIPRFLEHFVKLTDAEGVARTYIVTAFIQALCDGSQNRNCLCSSIEQVASCPG
jgi:hypothetical protein